MKIQLTRLAIIVLFAATIASCGGGGDNANTDATVVTDTLAAAEDFQYMTEQFDDIKIIRYQIPAWDELSLNNKKLAYYLTQAGLCGRDIMYDQNYRYNLAIRRTLESIYTSYAGNRAAEDWKAFEIYLKKIWFANGIHHHYSYDKFEPGFSKAYFQSLLDATGLSLEEGPMTAMFDPAFDNKKVSKEGDVDLIQASAVNFYAPDITQAEVEAFYKKKKATGKDAERPISYGLNSKLVKNANGEIEERVWKVEGMYSPAIEGIVAWLELAAGVAENPQQQLALELLADYYRTGDLEIWDQYNIAWVQDTTSTVDYINGFVEVYNDPLGYRGSMETIVEIKDLDASAKMKVIAENAQYFEDNSPIMDEHKKSKVVGISYNFINVVGEAGDASPSTPIGVNLPNANWIRSEYGSKSVSLGNIVSAYAKAGTSGFLEEFSNDSIEIVLSKKYGKQADKLHTALHEVIGHASGKLNPGVGTPKETLKNYSSTLEEARADLVALYYMMDPKLIEIGVMDDLDCGRHAYDDYIKNGLMLQMRRLKEGDVIEEDHMRNRQLVAAWAYEQGEPDSVITMVSRDGNTYFEINDYEQLQVIFGQLLREIQRIKSEGDFEAGKALVEDYGVQVDPVLHAEMLARSEQFDSAPYGGFINPILEPVEENGEIVDIKVVYPDDFAEQMLYYAKKYTFLPYEN
jgi:dipeptidyl-peptidase-3